MITMNKRKKMNIFFSGAKQLQLQLHNENDNDKEKKKKNLFFSGAKRLQLQLHPDLRWENRHRAPTKGILWIHRWALDKRKRRSLPQVWPHIHIYIYAKPEVEIFIYIEKLGLPFNFWKTRISMRGQEQDIWKGVMESWRSWSIKLRSCKAMSSIVGRQRGFCKTMVRSIVADFAEPPPQWSHSSWILGSLNGLAELQSKYALFAALWFRATERSRSINNSLTIIKSWSNI